MTPPRNNSENNNTMEWLILGIFSVSLLICIGFDLSILWALAFGLLLFLLYGRKKGFSWRELTGMAVNGVKTVRNILITFLLIGILTALWRAGGTIPVIVSYAAGWIKPSVFLLMTFLLNCGISFLIGTSFGTSATMGVICATMGNAMGVSPVLTGGAVLSGVYFGDRCSPVSTSALLVATVTGTDIYRNISRMLRTALIPFLVSCGIYLAAGTVWMKGASGAAGASGAGAFAAGGAIDLMGIFSRAFVLHWAALIPAAVIFGLALCRVNVKIAMSVSIVSAIPLCLILQHMSVPEVLRAAVFGFTPQDPEVAAMVSGGGIVSMLRVAGIVCISSSYSDIFKQTGLLDGAKKVIASIGAKTTSYTAAMVTSIAAGMIACNQTLTILLTNQLCSDLNPDREEFAVDLEDSAAVIAPLIPWSIAGAVPLSAIGAPVSAILASFYLILLPVWRTVLSWVKERRR